MEFRGGINLEEVDKSWMWMKFGGGANLEVDEIWEWKLNLDKIETKIWRWTNFGTGQVDRMKFGPRWTNLEEVDEIWMWMKFGICR